MLRFLGAVLLAGGAGLLGISATNRLNKRVRHLRALLGALTLMERELAFRLTPMPELLGRLAERTEEPVCGLFARCLEGISNLAERPLAQIWRDALVDTPLILGEQERATLGELGDILGSYDGPGQLEAIARARDRLAQDLVGAERDREKQGRMYSVLGLSSGALLVILLL